MKILYDYQAFQMQNIGGISRCFAELIHHLPREVSYELPLKESDNLYLKEYGINTNILPLGFHYNNFLCQRNFKGKRRLFRLYYEKIKGMHSADEINMSCSIEAIKNGNFDIFHPTYFNYYYLPYLNKKPFVLTIHDMIPEQLPEYYSKNDIQIEAKKKLVDKAAHIIAVSETTKKDIIELLNVSEKKISVIYHGEPDDTFNDNLNFPIVNHPYLLYVGARWHYKNFIPFIKACLPTLKRNPLLKILCTGKNFTSEELILFKQLNIQDKIIHKFANSHELANLYKYATAFVFPSMYEGFGIPILEAFKMGCPVLLNKTSCFPEIAGDAALYFSLEEDNTNLDSVLHKVLNISAERKIRLQQKGYERLKQYSWKHSANLLSDLYTSLI